MTDAQSIARAFAPFAAIEEFQSVVAQRSKKKPLFLHRNLSYSAVHQERTERDQNATSIVHLHLEPLNAPPGYSNSITVVAAVCAVLSGPDGRDAMVPIAAKVAKVGLRPSGPNAQSQQPPNSTSPPGSSKSLGVTLSMKVPFAQGILPKDIVVVVLHKRDRSISRVVRHINKAKHRGFEWNRGGREVTCTIKNNHAFQWYKSGTNVLFAAVQPSEEMMLVPPQPGNTNFSPSGTGGGTGAGTSTTPGNITSTPPGISTKRGVMELQPGIIETTQEPSVSEDGDVIPSNFSFKNGAIGDATPMLRYVLSLEGIKPTKKRKRDSFGVSGRGHHGRANGTGAGGGGGSRQNNSFSLSSLYPPPVTVNFCSIDGSIKVYLKLTHGYSCPFESCGLRCKNSVGALHHHLLASHPYYDYFLTKGDDQSTEIWIRCKKQWFGPNGKFLPASGVIPIRKNKSIRRIQQNENENNGEEDNNNNITAAAGTGAGAGTTPPHPLAPLLHETPKAFPFQYYCREEQRKYRLQEGGKYPVDHVEEEMEERAAVAVMAAAAGAGASFAWDTADLAPIEPEIEEGRTASELLNSEPEEDNAGGGAAGRARPPRDPSSRQRMHHAGPSHLSKQASLPIKLPLTDHKGLPKFYHRGRCIAMTEQELEKQEEDSDDDSDTEQYMRYCSTALEEKPNLCPEELEFMLAWNLYSFKNPIQADSQVPAACIAFAKAHGEKLRDAGGSFRRCFAAHVMNLWKFRLLTPTQMHEALVAAGGGGGGDGGGAGGGVSAEKASAGAVT